MCLLKRSADNPMQNTLTLIDAENAASLRFEVFSNRNSFQWACRFYLTTQGVGLEGEDPSLCVQAPEKLIVNQFRPRRRLSLAVTVCQVAAKLRLRADQPGPGRRPGARAAAVTRNRAGEPRARPAPHGGTFGGPRAGRGVP
jgi:hypothetical protein